MHIFKYFTNKKVNTIYIFILNYIHGHINNNHYSGVQLSLFGVNNINFNKVRCN